MRILLFGSSGFIGRHVRAALAEAGFELAQSGIDDVDSGFTIALVDASTERTFVTSRGAEGRLTRADLDRVAVTGDDIVHVSGYGLAHPENAAALPGWLHDLPPATRVLTDPSPLVDEVDPAVNVQDRGDAPYLRHDSPPSKPCAVGRCSLRSPRWFFPNCPVR